MSSGVRRIEALTGEAARAAFDAPNVVQMPLSEFERRHKELPHDRELIMACRSGGRSARAMQFLLDSGYENVVNLAGISQSVINLLLGLADEAFRMWGNVLAGDANISVRIELVDTSGVGRAAPPPRAG